jgi:hypothetical protein
MPFNDLVLLALAGNIAAVYNAVEAARGAPDTITPTALEADAFLGAFIDVVENEAKGVYNHEPELRHQRLLALALLRAWLAEDHALLVLNINKPRFVFQLALRIRRPRIVNQGGFGLCGPATILVALAKRDPMRYANFVVELVQTGSSDWAPGEAVTLTATDNGLRGTATPEADFLPLLALRCRAELILAGGASGGIDFDLATQDSHATTPLQLVALLQRAGYHDVNDMTTSRRSFSVARTSTQLDAVLRHLQNCATKLSGPNREVVIMLVHPDIARRAKNGAAAPWGHDPTVAALARLHWILVKSLAVDIVAGSVTIKISTWRWSGTVVLPLAEFVPRYYGYVLARA